VNALLTKFIHVQEQTTRYADVLHPYTQKSREAIRELDPTNDLTYIRLRSKKHEIMIAPDKDYTMAVVQNANP
jgi:dynein light chain roadblock-type